MASSEISYKDNMVWQSLSNAFTIFQFSSVSSTMQSPSSIYRTRKQQITMAKVLPHNLFVWNCTNETKISWMYLKKSWMLWLSYYVHSYQVHILLIWDEVHSQFRKSVLARGQMYFDNHGTHETYLSLHKRKYA